MFLQNKFNINFESNLTSKFLNKYYKNKINKLFLFFVIKDCNKFKILFFFILIVIMLGKYPKILKKKKLYFRFLGFYYKNILNFLFDLVLIYLPVLGVLLETDIKLKGLNGYFILNDFPYMYEVDLLCEKHNKFLDYFLDFKFVFFFSFKKYYSKLFNEMFLRSFYKIPLQILNRT